MVNFSLMRVSRRSPLTGRENVRHLPITQDMLDRWEQGELIQDAFPHLSIEDREFIKTGLTAEDWKELFKDLK